MDNFDDLQEWGECLDRLAEIDRSGTVDQHQEGFVRLLRYPYNWQLRQAALKSARNLESPTTEVIEEVFRIASHGDGPLDERLLALGTMSCLAERARSGVGESSGKVLASIAERTEAMLAEPCAPVLQQAMRGCLTACGKASGTNAELSNKPELPLDAEGATT